MKKYHVILLLVASAVHLPAQIEVVSGGNVGVGTSSPSAKLDIAGTTALGTTATGGNLMIRSYSDGRNWYVRDDAGVDRLRFSRGGSDQPFWDILKTSGSDAIAGQIWYVNGAERMRLDGSGNVGIGTTSPGARLDVVDASGNAYARIFANNPSNGRTSTLEIAAANGGDSGTASILKFSALVSQQYSKLQIQNSAGTNLMTILNGGNAGIGTTSPGTKLEVKGDELRVRAVVSKTDTTARTLLRLNSDDTVGSSALEMAFTLQGAASGGSRYAQIQSADHGYGWASLILNPNGGNVGIGTTTPSQKLHVAGSVRATSFISDTTTYADFVFRPGYALPSLSTVEAHIKEHGHLPGIPSEAEAREHGIDLAAMQVKLLQKVEELTLHQIAQQKEIEALKAQNARLQQRVAALDASSP